MTWATARAALVEAIRLAAGRSEYGATVAWPEGSVRWFGEPDAFISDTTQTGVYLRHVALKNNGRPERRYGTPATPAGDIPLVTARQAVWTVQVQVVALEELGAQSAVCQAEDITATLEDDDIADGLATAGLAIGSTGPVQVVSRTFGDRTLEVAILDLHLNLVENRVGQPVSYIWTVEAEEGTVS